MCKMHPLSDPLQRRRRRWYRNSVSGRSFTFSKRAVSWSPCSWSLLAACDCVVIGDWNHTRNAGTLCLHGCLLNGMLASLLLSRLEAAGMVTSGTTADETLASSIFLAYSCTCFVGPPTRTVELGDLSATECKVQSFGAGGSCIHADLFISGHCDRSCRGNV
jgi:hypothetical protein